MRGVPKPVSEEGSLHIISPLLKEGIRARQIGELVRLLSLRRRDIIWRDRGLPSLRRREIIRRPESSFVQLNFIKFKPKRKSRGSIYSRIQEFKFAKLEYQDSCFYSSFESWNIRTSLFRLRRTQTWLILHQILSFYLKKHFFKIFSNRQKDIWRFWKLEFLIFLIFFTFSVFFLQSF